jgi:hypothetical protein
MHPLCMCFICYSLVSMVFILSMLQHPVSFVTPVHTLYFKIKFLIAGLFLETLLHLSVHSVHVVASNISLNYCIFGHVIIFVSLISASCVVLWLYLLTVLISPCEESVDVLMLQRHGFCCYCKNHSSQTKKYKELIFLEGVS